MMHTVRMMRAGTLLDNPATSNLSTGLSQTAAAGMVVQSYCTQVGQQPNIVIPEHVVKKLPPINEYLKTARSNAGDYLKNVQPQIILVVTDVAGYATEFTSFYNLISGKIGDWKGGSGTARQDALTLLKQLQADLGKRQANVTTVATALAAFQGKLNADVGNFATAKQQADIVIGGDQGAIAELDTQINDLNGKIAGAATGVALSGLAILGGIFMIVVGAVAGFVTAGTSTPLVVAGSVVLVAGAAGLTASSIVLATLIDSKSGLLQQKAQLDADVKFLTDFSGTMQGLHSAAANASTALNNLSNAWGVLGGNLGNVVRSVEGAQTYSDLPIVVQAYLNTAQGQWSDVLKNAQTIQAQMSGVQNVTLRDAKGNLSQLSSKTIPVPKAA